MDQSPQFLICILVAAALLLLCCICAAGTVGGETDTTGFNGAERDALDSLKAVFNSTYLNQNWTGLQYCYMDKPAYWYGIQCSDGRVTGISLESMGLDGNVGLDAFVNLTQLSFLSLKNNSISGNVMDFSSNQKLRHIDLSGNMLGGSIPDSLLSLKLLETLQLQDNKLKGPIPEFDQPSLRELNVSNNNLNGRIPRTTEALRLLNLSSYIGNPQLCGRPTLVDCNYSFSNNDTAKSNEDSSTSRFAIYFIIVDILGLLVIVLLFLCYYKKSKELQWRPLK